MNVFECVMYHASVCHQMRRVCGEGYVVECVMYRSACHQVRHVSCKCVRSHMNESCRTHEGVMSNVCMNHAIHMNESHIWMSHATHTNESCHKFVWVMPHIWMSHATDMNESCHTYRTRKRIMHTARSQRTEQFARLWKGSHVTHMDESSHINESCHTHESVMYMYTPRSQRM